MSDDFIEGTLVNGTKVRYVREERLDAALARVEAIEVALRDIVACEDLCHLCAAQARRALSAPAAPKAPERGACERCSGKGSWVDVGDGRAYPCPDCKGAGSAGCAVCDAINATFPGNHVRPCPLGKGGK